MSELMEQPRKIVPPIYLALSILLMYLLDRYIPLVIFGGPFVWGFASAFISAGMVLIIYSAGLFKKAGTALVPFKESTALVVSGPFKVSRNPMYLGMVSILTGVAGMLGGLTAFLVVFAFIWIIESRFIEGEERFMETLFGAEYLDYKKRVRRWL